MRQCSQLLAIISSYTLKSWWVPFEIGEATALARRITSYKNGNMDLPPFLKIWPVLTRDSQLQLFIQEYEKDRRIIFEEKIHRTHASVAMDGMTPSSAEKFHSSLKSKLF